MVAGQLLGRLVSGLTYDSQMLTWWKEDPSLPTADVC